MTHEPVSITDFMTDGSLAALCEAVSALAGVTVELHDSRGRAVVSAVGESRWSVRDGTGIPGGAALASAPIFSAPLSVSEGPLGSLVVLASDGALTSDELPAIERIVSLVASIVSELCEHQLQLRQRVEALEVLGRLSSLLVAAGDADGLLRVAVRAAAETIGADAGTIRTLDSTGRELMIRAWWGLSDQYVVRAMTVPVEAAPDRAALLGEVVCIEDLLDSPGDPQFDSRREEGLRSMISAGLVFQGRPVGILRLFSREPRRFTEAEQSLLRAIGQQSAAALANARLLETEKEHRRVRQQVRLAADVQRRLFPRSAPAAPGVDIAARAVPSFELSGDFYDFIELSGHVGLVVGDVVGKGVAAALLMASVRSALRAYAQDLYHLDEVMNRVNQAMCRDTLDNEFATIFYGVLDPGTRRLTYCNAGHEPPLLLRPRPGHAPEDSDIVELTQAGMVVGIDPTERYERAHYDLRPGDVLLICTDGLADARDFSGAKYGKARIRDALRFVVAADPNATADRIADHLIWESRRFVGMNRRVDDTTLLVMRIEAKA